MTTETELTLALRVIELTDLRDKLLEQNKSYRNSTQKAQEEVATAKKLPPEEFSDVVSRITRRHKTVLNVLSLLRRSTIDHEDANFILLIALSDPGKQFTEAQVIKTLRDARPARLAS